MMADVNVGARGAAGSSRKPIAVLCVGAVLLFAQPAKGQGLDRETAAGLGNAPNALKACVLDGSGVTARPPEQGSEPLHRIRLEWKPPHVGRVSKYEVYRSRVVTGNTLRDAGNRVALCGTATTRSCGTPLATTFVDPEELPSGGSFVYFVVAEFDDGTRSGPSNFATVAISGP